MSRRHSTNQEDVVGYDAVNAVSDLFKPFLRAPFNYDTMAASDESGLLCPEPSLTQQNQVEESDINTIVTRFLKTGELQQANRPPTYGDFTSSGDYHASLNRVIEAQSAFDSLPANIRARFANDPANLLDFLADEKNLDEAVKLGLANPRDVAGLSTGLPDRPSKGQAGETVGKPSKGTKSSVRSSKEDLEGDEGDE